MEGNTQCKVIISDRSKKCFLLNVVMHFHMWYNENISSVQVGGGCFFKVQVILHLIAK